MPGMPQHRLPWPCGSLRAADGQRVHQGGHAPFARHAHPCGVTPCRRHAPAASGRGDEDRRGPDHAGRGAAAPDLGRLSPEGRVSSADPPALREIHGLQSSPASRIRRINPDSSAAVGARRLHAHQESTRFLVGTDVHRRRSRLRRRARRPTTVRDLRRGRVLATSRSAWASCRRCWRCRAVQVTDHRDRRRRPHRCRGLETAAHHRGGHAVFGFLLPHPWHGADLPVLVWWRHWRAMNSTGRTP